MIGSAWSRWKRVIFGCYELQLLTCMRLWGTIFELFCVRPCIWFAHGNVVVLANACFFIWVGQHWERASGEERCAEAFRVTPAVTKVDSLLRAPSPQWRKDCLSPPKKDFQEISNFIENLLNGDRRRLGWLFGVREYRRAAGVETRTGEALRVIPRGKRCWRFTARPKFTSKVHADFPKIFAQNLEYLAALWSDLDEKLSSWS